MPYKDLGVKISVLYLFVHFNCPRDLLSTTLFFLRPFFASDMYKSVLFLLAAASTSVYGAKIEARERELSSFPFRFAPSHFFFYKRAASLGILQLVRAP